MTLQKIWLKYRVFQAVVFLGLGLLLTIALSLSFGAVPMSAAQLWQAFLHRGDAVNQTIFWELRLPRVAAALTVSAALGMSESLLQGLLRNCLADPFVLGISAGAGLVAITMLTLGIFQTWVPLAAWIGAILTSMLVYFLGKTKTGISVERLVLAGVAVSYLFGAIQTTLLLLAEDSRLQAALNWLIGSLNGRGWSDLQVAAPSTRTNQTCRNSRQQISQQQPQIYRNYRSHWRTNPSQFGKNHRIETEFSGRCVGISRPNNAKIAAAWN